ncbi:DNA recombination protein RmuC [Pelagerythrobacter aerophilus]|uniref:DNA recombination protein RmuC homolog n=1 Tax=Pelagerythrobacter aerophilus TaxID=2306995 RepID=A0A418NMH3_9SPHN|nr:DNA recombination protein RmuC [Pelagerythrobacter aerophilus]RIV81278.1 DNA recombination protein RmuC [Pelagerythrobacter aerophilus]
MTATIIALLALGFGAALGWFLGSRPAADWRARHEERDAEAKELAGKLSRMAPELAAMGERAARADDLAAKLDAARDELVGLKAERAAFEEQKRLLEESRANLLKEFENTGAKVLGAAQERFLERAAERLGHSEKASEEKIKALLQPVGDRLRKYEEQVATLEEKRTDAFARLHQQITEMQRGQEEVRREAQRLGNSLTNAPKARGRWGERALQNVLEQCGLSQHTDFILEHSMETEEGRLRPDAIVRVPGQKKLVIDAKVSLNAYQAAFEADDDDERRRHLDLHARSMRGHVQTLGAKSYQSQFDEAPDYVVMFVPGEHFVAAALEHDPELWDFAFEKRVLLATPTNLVAIARTVAQVWRQDTIAREAIEIGKAGAELYDRLAIAAEHMKRVGGGLETAVNNYNKFVGSFERNVLSSGRRLKDKGIEIGKREIDEVPLVESAPRYTAEDSDATKEPALPSVGSDNE